MVFTDSPGKYHTELVKQSQRRNKGSGAGCKLVPRELFYQARNNLKHQDSENISSHTICLLYLEYKCARFITG